MDLEGADIFGCRYPKMQPSEPLLERELCCNPSTPAATSATTLSSTGSPEPFLAEERETPPPEMNINERIKIKKSDCVLRLFGALSRKAVGMWNRDIDYLQISFLTNKHITGQQDKTLLPTNFHPIVLPDDIYPELRDPQDFVLVWQQGILPFLATFAKEWFGAEYTIGLRRGKSPQARTINIMTGQEVSSCHQRLVAQHVLDILPRTFHDSTTFSFNTGSLRRLAAEKMPQTVELDPICNPRNTYSYSHPMIGDSVGLALNQGDDHSTSTLGSCLIAGETSYWLLNFHPFAEALNNSNLPLREMTVEHPSPDDRNMCYVSGHKRPTEHDRGFEIGKMMEISGPDNSTTRISQNPYWKLAGLERPQVIMDWALCTAKSLQVNTIRRPTSEGHTIQTICTLLGMNEASGAPVYSVGRTSGLCKGQIGLCPDLVSTKVTGALTETMEWFVEEPYPYDDQMGWVESGIGVNGDSGAAILDQETHGLYGHLWGRNEDKVGRTTPRVTYFTPIDDIFDDIQEKVSISTRPRLPQLSEAFIPPLYPPICSRCRMQDQAWNEGFTLLLEPGSPGIDITRSEEDSYREITPMEDMTASIEMTPQDAEILTPEDMRSPDMQRHRMLLFEHTGLSCLSSFQDQSGCQTKIPSISLLGASDNGISELLPLDNLEVDSDEFEHLSSSSGLKAKRLANAADATVDSSRGKRQKIERQEP
jgi:hypothetical protein